MATAWRTVTCKYRPLFCAYSSFQTQRRLTNHVCLKEEMKLQKIMKYGTLYCFLNRCFLFVCLLTKAWINMQFSWFLVLSFLSFWCNLKQNDSVLSDDRTMMLRVQDGDFVMSERRIFMLKPRALRFIIICKLTSCWSTQMLVLVATDIQCELSWPIVNVSLYYT